ncbi:10091_t:CDS:2, partial [Gigaspora rosea]
FQQEENDCPTYFKLSKDVIKEIKKSGETKIDPYDLTYLKKGLEDYCDQPFNCDPDTAKEYWSKIEHVCAKELSGKTDWSNDPTKIDKTKLMVYDTFLTYYFGIPDHHGLCYKYSDSDADLKYVIKKDGSKVPVPKKAFCGEKCFETEAKIYISWIKECKLSPELSEEVFYGSEKDFIDFLSCKTEDKRNIIRRTSEFYLSPIRSLAGFLN